MIWKEKGKKEMNEQADVQLKVAIKYCQVMELDGYETHECTSSLTWARSSRR